MSDERQVMARKIHTPSAITGLPDFMKREYLRAEIKRWGWMRMLFKWLMWCLVKYAGLHIYRVNKRPLGGHPGSPDLPSGISLAIVPPGKLQDAAVDPELDMDPKFVRAALARGDLAFGAFDGDLLIDYVWRTFTAAPAEDGLWVRVDRPCRRSGVQRDLQLSQHCRCQIPGKA